MILLVIVFISLIGFWCIGILLCVGHLCLLFCVMLILQGWCFARFRYFVSLRVFVDCELVDCLLVSGGLRGWSFRCVFVVHGM